MFADIRAKYAPFPFPGIECTDGKGLGAMCAIAGVINLKTDSDIKAKMLSTMKRRGPDDSGCYSYNDICLFHTRLAIIDPAGGRQPMHLHWANEDYTIIYNGELYNTDEIRRSLIACGHYFTGHSDTEVVLHAYAEWSEECVHQFNGIFAFAVLEQKRNRVFLARDRMGVKPLFYKIHNSGLIFASEIKTILAYPTVRAELDEIGAAELLLLGPGRTPGSGVFRGIYELEPGCCGYYTDGDLHWKRYWILKDREHTDSFDDTVAYVRFLVTDAIKRQMVSDVPIGTFLSGGLDSSIITAICAGEKNKAGESLPTFSVDYANNDQFFVANKFQPNSDGSYIRIMQKHVGSEHHWTILTPEDLTNALRDATNARDLPGMADVDFSLLVFCRHIRKQVKVALSGECADEIFGGYPWYRDPEVIALKGFPWAQNTKQRADFIAPNIIDKIDPNDFVMSRYKQTIDESDILPGASPQEKRMKQMVNLNHRWFMQTLLDRKDRMSMYHGLEVRVPFCDYRIAEYLYGVPWEFKDHNGQEKGLLRMAVRGLLPNEVLFRKKSPYPKTYDPHYLQLVSQMLSDVLNRKNAPILQIVNRKALEKLMVSEYAWPWYGQLMRVPQTIAYMLQLNYWMEAYNVSII